MPRQLGRLVRPLRFAKLGALLLYVAACGGGVPLPGGEGAKSPPGGGASGGREGQSPPGAAPGSMGGADPAAAECRPGTPWAAPIRRLSRSEYDNTVRDLLGEDSTPGQLFPPDEVAGGFSNNARLLSVSPLLAEKYQEAAERLAASAVAPERLGQLVDCAPAQGDEACARRFVTTFGLRAYRRPLASEEVDRLLSLYALGSSGQGGSFAEGIEVVLRAMLQAPTFLYRLESAPAGGGRLDPYEVASRLSYFLWGTMPDQRLFEAAGRDALGTKEEILAMAQTMLEDPRAHAGISDFFEQWLGTAGLQTLEKDAAAYPEWNEGLRAAMREETRAFVADLVLGDARSLGALLSARRGFLRPELAKLYGVSDPAAPDTATVLPEERAGILTHAGLLAVHALPDQSSPVHRGKLVRERLLCQDMPPQPPDLMITAPEVDPSKSTRERFAEHASNPACSSCHLLMDPIGFGFEAYDGIGRFRRQEGGADIDTAGELVGTRDANGRFEGVAELSARLAKSGEVQDCVATQWYRYAMGRFEGPGDACALRDIRQAFASSEQDLRALLLALIGGETFLFHPSAKEAP